MRNILQLSIIGQTFYVNKKDLLGEIKKKIEQKIFILKANNIVRISLSVQLIFAIVFLKQNGNNYAAFLSGVEPVWCSVVRISKMETIVIVAKKRAIFEFVIEGRDAPAPAPAW